MGGKTGLGAFLYVSGCSLAALGIIYHAQIAQELVRHYDFADSMFTGSGDLSYTVGASGIEAGDSGISLEGSIEASGRGLSPESSAAEIADDGESPATESSETGSAAVSRDESAGKSEEASPATGAAPQAGTVAASASPDTRPGANSHKTDSPASCSRSRKPFVLSRGDSVLFIGDSLMHDLAPAAASELKARGIKSVNASKSGTGLRTETGREWKKNVSDIMKSDSSIRLVVVMIGANDPVGFFEGKTVVKFGSDKWREFYRGRIAEIYALAGRHGASVMWYSLPAMKSRKYDAKAKVLSGLFSEEAEKQGGIMIPADVISPGGSYAAFLSDHGTMKQVRKDDGIHFTMFGAGLLARDFMKRLQRLEEKSEVLAASPACAPSEGGKGEILLAESGAREKAGNPDSPARPGAEPHGAASVPNEAAAAGQADGTDDDIEPAELAGVSTEKTESSRGLIPEAGADGLFEVMANDRVLFVGDSLMQGIAPQIIRELDRRSIRYSNPSMKSTGLLVRKSCNWFEKTEKELSDDAAIRYMVVMLGLNDPMGFYVNGKPQAFGTEGWISSYREFVDRIYAIADRHHVRVFWYKIPPVRGKTLDSKIPVLNDIFEAEAGARGGVFLEVPAMAPDGKYAAYIPIDGKSRKVRADDGIHFNVRGAGVMAAEFLRHLRFSESERNLRFYDPGFARKDAGEPDEGGMPAAGGGEKGSVAGTGRKAAPGAGASVSDGKAGGAGNDDGMGRKQSGHDVPGRSALYDSIKSAGTDPGRTAFSDFTDLGHVQTAGAKHV